MFGIKRLKEIIIIVVSHSLIVSSQNHWTLEQCIQRSIDFNPQLKQSENNLKLLKINFQEALWSFAPSINSSHTLQYDYGRSSDDSYNITFDPKLSTRHSVSASLQLFRGFSKLQAANAEKYFLLAGVESNEMMKIAITLKVTDAWYNLLLQRKNIELREAMYKGALEREKIFRQRFNNGLSDRSEILRSQSMTLQSENMLLRAQNDFRAAELYLRQLMYIEVHSPFEADSIDEKVSIISVPKIQDLYETALTNYPQIAQIEYELKALNFEIKSESGRLWPNINANSGIYSSYFKNEGKSAESFQVQLNDKINMYTGITVNIPVFNGFVQQNRVKRMHIAFENKKIELNAKKLELWNTLETEIGNLESFVSEFTGALKSYDIQRLNYKTEQQKFSEGLSNYADMILAEEMLLNAGVQLMSSRINVLFQQKVLELYCGTK